MYSTCFVIDLRGHTLRHRGLTVVSSLSPVPLEINSTDMDLKSWIHFGPAELSCDDRGMAWFRSVIQVEDIDIF